jgi:hypothetical protein
LIEFVLKPAMVTKKPLKLEFISTAVNLIVTVVNCFFTYKFGRLWLTKYNWWWEPLDRSSSEEALQVANEFR